MAMYNNVTGCYPGCYARANGGSWPVAVWPSRLRLFLNGNRDVFLCPERDADRFAWSDHPINAWPGVKDMTGYGYEAGEPMLSLDTTPFPYGYNGYGVLSFEGRPPLALSGDTTPTVSWGQPELKVSRVKMPSEMIAIADSQGDAQTDLMLSAFQDTTCPPGKIHRGGANVLFCDGHVEWCNYNDITLSPSDDTTAKWGRVAPLWRNDHFAPGL